MDRERVYHVGWILGMVAYLFPVMNGLRLYLEFVPPMWLGAQPVRPMLYVGIVNLIATGVTGMGVCAAGLRRKIRAFWFLHLFFLLWVVLQDLAAVLTSGHFPWPLFPGTLAALSLFLTRSCLRREG